MLHQAPSAHPVQCFCSELMLLWDVLGKTPKGQTKERAKAMLVTSGLIETAHWRCQEDYQQPKRCKTSAANLWLGALHVRQNMQDPHVQRYTQRRCH